MSNCSCGAGRVSCTALRNSSSCWSDRRPTVAAATPSSMARRASSPSDTDATVSGVTTNWPSAVRVTSPSPLSLVSA